MLVHAEGSGESLRAIVDAGLTMAQVIALHVLSVTGPIPVSTLADHLRLSRAATSQLVEKLVQEKLLDRHEDASDRRLRHVELTKKGRALQDELFSARIREMNEVLARLTPGLRERLADVLEDVTRELRGETCRAPSSS